MTLPERERVSKPTGVCRQVLRQASALSDGEVTPQAAFGIRRHLLDCPGCRAHIDEMTRLVAVLESLPAFEPPPEVAERLLAAVRGRVEEGPRPRRPRRLARHLKLVVGSLAGGGLLLYPLGKVFAPGTGQPGILPSDWEVPPVLLEKILAAVSLLMREMLEGIRQLVLGFPGVPSTAPGPVALYAAWPYLLLVAAGSLGFLLMTTPWLAKDLFGRFRCPNRRKSGSFPAPLR